MQSFAVDTNMEDFQVSTRPSHQPPLPGKEVFSSVLILLGYLQTSLGSVYKAYLKSISEGFMAQY